MRSERFHSSGRGARRRETEGRAAQRQMQAAKERDELQVGRRAATGQRPWAGGGCVGSVLRACEGACCRIACTGRRCSSAANSSERVLALKRMGGGPAGDVGQARTTASRCGGSQDGRWTGRRRCSEEKLVRDCPTAGQRDSRLAHFRDWGARTAIPIRRAPSPGALRCLGRPPPLHARAGLTNAAEPPAPRRSPDARPPVGQPAAVEQRGCRRRLPSSTARSPRVASPVCAPRGSIYFVQPVRCTACRRLHGLAWLRSSDKVRSWPSSLQTPLRGPPGLFRAWGSEGLSKIACRHPTQDAGETLEPEPRSTIARIVTCPTWSLEGPRRSQDTIRRTHPQPVSYTLEADYQPNVSSCQ